MPTQFTRCDECNIIKCFPIDHEYNLDQYKNFDICNILLEAGLPLEICEIIIKKNDYLQKCTFCQKKLLCETHTERGRKYGLHYRGYGIMCDQCCWWEVG
jgi:hypothetical protein